MFNIENVTNFKIEQLNLNELMHNKRIKKIRHHK